MIAPVETVVPEGTKPKRPRKAAEKIDPKYPAAARELRDRYLEEVNSGRALIDGSSKYDVSRALTSAEARRRALPEAA